MERSIGRQTHRSERIDGIERIGHLDKQEDQLHGSVGRQILKYIGKNKKNRRNGTSRQINHRLRATLLTLPKCIQTCCYAFCSSYAMCVCYATRSSYARADRLAAMLLAQNLHVRADLPLGRSVFRYVVKKKRIEGRGLLDSRWIARQIDKWMDGWMDGWIYRQIDRQIDRWVDRQIESQTSCYSTCSSQLRTDLLLRLRFLLFLCMCICYTTRSSYARARQTCCNVTGSPLARGQWLAAAPLAFLMHVHTDLLLRYLLVLRMAGRRAFYATCSSYA